LKLLVETYCDVPWINSQCGYGCSDHASWYRQGYSTVYTLEASFEDTSPYLHSIHDSMEHVSLDHMKEHVKLILGWIIELTSKFQHDPSTRDLVK
jgi:leucyl aminopeptidase